MKTKEKIKRLSKKNYDSLNETFLYKKKPIIDNSFSVGTTSGTYHCKNWTFRVHKRDGGASMADTYFGDAYTIVTDRNIKGYKKVFDFREVKKIGDDEVDEYCRKDLYYAATNSGGYSCGNLYWVKKTAQKSKRLLIKKKREEIKSLKQQLEWAEEGLKRLNSPNPII